MATEMPSRSEAIDEVVWLAHQICEWARAQRDMPDSVLEHLDELDQAVMMFLIADLHRTG